MKITTLVENTTVSDKFIPQHGLSLHIETGLTTILFDAGPGDSLIKNAAKSGIDLTRVDVFVLSHGHYDHGGGLRKFLKRNNRAKIYCGTGAFEKHYATRKGAFRKSIGVRYPSRAPNPVLEVDGQIQINEQLILFNQVTNQTLPPPENKNLLARNETGKIGPDPFDHEVNLIVSTPSGDHLICGCAHKGIVNIIIQAKNIIGRPLKTVVGGFHLMGLEEPRRKEYLDSLAHHLSSLEIDRYYTCHCTGEENARYLAQKIPYLEYLPGGRVIKV